MKRELETAIEDRCVAKVQALGGMALKLAIPGVRGFPDRSVLLPDRRVFFLETKRLKTGRVSAQQHRWRALLDRLGFDTYFVDNDDEFDSILEEWR